MTPLDTQLIIRKTKLIEQDLEKLAQNKPKSLDDYLNNQDLQLKVERLLERVVGRIIDINYHILSEEYDIVPNDYFKSFITMGKKGLIPEKLAKKLAKSAGLRNILAHEYDEIDHKKVHEAINKALTQIPQYLKCVLGLAKTV